MISEQLAWIHRSRGLASCSTVEEEAELSNDRLSCTDNVVVGGIVLTDEEKVEPSLCGVTRWEHQL